MVFFPKHKVDKLISTIFFLVGVGLVVRLFFNFGWFTLLGAVICLILALLTLAPVIRNAVLQVNVKEKVVLMGNFDDFIPLTPDDLKVVEVLAFGIRRYTFEKDGSEYYLSPDRYYQSNLLQQKLDKIFGRPPVER